MPSLTWQAYAIFCFISFSSKVACVNDKTAYTCVCTHTPTYPFRQGEIHENGGQCPIASKSRSSRLHLLPSLYPCHLACLLWAGWSHHGCWWSLPGLQRPWLRERETRNQTQQASMGTEGLVLSTPSHSPPWGPHPTHRKLRQMRGTFTSLPLSPLLTSCVAWLLGTLCVTLRSWQLGDPSGVLQQAPILQGW